MTRPRLIVIDSLLIFLLAAALIWPLFRLKYMNNWGSIESTFIADARFLKEHWPHPNWQPLWYCGTRFDFVYPPALRYGTTVLAKYWPMTEARAYHIYTAFFYCLGIAGVYLFVWVVSGRRGPAWLAAAASAIISPSFLFLADMRNDAPLLTPQRLGVLIRYGEGPHITAFSLLPLALAAAWRALERWSPVALAAAAVLAALVVSNNFYGATSLAIWFPILLWSVWITHLDHWVVLRAAALAALSYGLTAFWLTPYYIEVTLNNMKLVSQPGNVWSIWVALAVWMAYMLASERLARGRRERGWGVLAWGTFLFFTLNVLGHHYLNFRILGEPLRMVPELDLALILAVVALLGWPWNRNPEVIGLQFRGSSYARLICVVAAIFALLPAKRYIRHAWELFPRDWEPQRRIEYRISEWMARHHPTSRVMATGSVRFWYDAWHNLQQLGGGSEQGLINQTVSTGYYRVAVEDNLKNAVDWLQSFGVDMVTVHEQRSQEVYKDFAEPHKFAKLLEKIYDSGEGDAIYKVPRRYPALARVVETARVAKLEPYGPVQNQDTVAAYAEALERGPDSPTQFAWEGTDAMRVRARVAAGQSVVVQVTYDPAWHAYSQGRPLRTRRDALGQILIETPAGEHDLRLVWELPRQNMAGRALSTLCAIVVIGLFIAGRR